MITLPVFDALFGDFEFAKSNPVSIAITEFLKSLAEHGVGDMSESDEASLDALYSSVARRAKMARTDNGRQALIKNLYEEFFRKAFRATTDKLGIVYTPDEIISYMLHATDRVLRREFHKSLADKDVHILDPFAGTGSFMARLIEDEELMPLDKLPYKYAHELHSNEILLLAYYIQIINIEYAYHSRTGEYKEFEGALLTDTFQMTEEQNTLDDDFFQDNTLRLLHQRDDVVPIACLSNPPYSIGQLSANDDNQNENYPTLDSRIRLTYSDTTSGLKKGLYDSYVRAYRWASDRIGNEGVLCYVSNASWLRQEAYAGMRRAFVKEFDSIYVLDLRGNQRTQGEESRKEGGKVFGSGSRAPIAITTLVKKSKRNGDGTIHYCDVGDYKTQREKLDFVAESAATEPVWDIIVPDSRGDWLNQRDEGFYTMAPLGITVRQKKLPSGMFTIWSMGVATNRDAWVWNYSKNCLCENVQRLIDNTNEETARIAGVINARNNDPHKYSWTRSMRGYAARGEILTYNSSHTVLGLYRPFTKQWLYFDLRLNESRGQNALLFPVLNDSESADNCVIAMAERGPLISNCLPDLELIHHGQCFPLYWYEKLEDDRLFNPDGAKVVKDAWGSRYARRDAITDTALSVFQSAYPNAYMTRAKKYGGPGINKEDIFYYVYGVLHSLEYRERFAANLAKELPRIPLVEDLEGFAEAGRKLADLHINYESLAPYPTVQTGLLDGVDPGKVQKMRWAKKKDPETGKRVNDYTTLIYNANVTITGIPETAQNYVVNGRSPIDWMIDRYQVKTDKKSGITNDPNLYSDDPCYIVNLVGKLVRVAVETNNIVATLPPIREIEHPTNWPTEWNVVE